MNLNQSFRINTISLHHLWQPEPTASLATDFQLCTRVSMKGKTSRSCCGSDRIAIEFARGFQPSLRGCLHSDFSRSNTLRSASVWKHRDDELLPRHYLWHQIQYSVDFLLEILLPPVAFATDDERIAILQCPHLRWIFLLLDR